MSQAMRRSRTRDALRAAGRELFASNPIDAVTVEEIVARAGVGKGSFYNHFADRETLLQVLVDDIRQEIEARVAAANAPIASASDRVARGVCVYVHFALTRRDEARIIARVVADASYLRSEVNEHLFRDLHAGLHEGDFDFATTDAAALLVLSVSLVAILAAIDLQDARAIVPLTQQLCEMLLKGLGAPSDVARKASARAVDALIRRPLEPAVADQAQAEARSKEEDL